MKFQVREARPRRRECGSFAAIAFLSFFFATPLSAADSIPVATPAHRLHIAAADGAIVYWRASADGVDAVLTPEFDAAIHSRHLQVIAGTDIASPDVLAFETEVTDASAEIFQQTRVGDSGLRVMRRLQLPEEGFRLRMRLEFSNDGSAPIDVRGPVAGPVIRLGPGLGGQRDVYEGIAASLYDFLNAVLLPANETEARVLHLNEEQTELSVATPILWAGLSNRYQLLAINAPPAMPFASVRLHSPSDVAQRAIADGRNRQHAAALDLDMPKFTLAPGETRAMEFDVYAGAKDISRLSRAEGFDLRPVMFTDLWEWMRWLCFALLWLMTAIDGAIGNLGVTIILLAIAVRLLLYPLGREAARQQLRFNQKQAELKPELERIKVEFKGGEQAERIFELYHRHGVSPAAGVKSLLVVLVQIPVFIALFHILGQALEFRGAPFLWIEDLARPDALFFLPFALPYFGSSINLLPILMAIVSVIAMGVNRAGDESRGQFLFLIVVNIGFFLVFYHFPAGMVLYWTMANLLHLLQHLLAGIRNGAAKRAG